MANIMDKMFEKLKKCFSIVCLLFTFGFVIWCIRTYTLDLDLTLLSQKNFGDDVNLIMPVVSFCLHDPFIKEKFENSKLGSNVSYLEYKKFVLGNIWDQKMLEIDFESVTKSIENYIVRYQVVWKSGLYNTYENMSVLPTFIKKPYPSYIGHILYSIVKCYAINIPMNTSVLSVTFKTSIFPDGIRPSMDGLGVSFHYPNQFFKSINNMRISWSKHIETQNKSLLMILQMKAFEVTIRRNSRRQPCDKKWRAYDFSVAQNKYATAGCRPVYDIWNSSYLPCKSKEKMGLATSFLGSENYKHEPCQSADKIDFEYRELYVNGSPDSFSIVVQMLRSQFKVIEHKQAYDLQNLIGNSGGYIGLFLGKKMSVNIN